MTVDQVGDIAQSLAALVLALAFVYFQRTTVHQRRRIETLETLFGSMIPRPESPQNVKVIRDGMTIPVELVYAGFEARGTHQWKVVTPTGEWSDDDPPLITADRMPEGATIMFAREGDDT